MLNADLKDVILRVLELDDWPMTASTQAMEIPGWDSLSHVRVLLAIEHAFGIRFSSREAMSMNDLGDLERLVDAKRKLKSSATPQQ